MKKIFASILALAAFVGCSKDTESNVVVNASKFVAPIEISVAESRAFDADLNWSWESSDVIAAYQNAGAKSVNQLMLNTSGNFYNNAFEYATEELAQFHFVYPASQLASDYSLTAAQTGVWTPVLYGTVEAATVKNLGTVEMNYLSSAFEVRVWEAGRAARKNIVKAVLSSANDFVPVWTVNNDLTYTQSFSGDELSLELNSDTAIFNLGEGDFTFTLTLTDAEGYTLSLPVSKNFVAGKRTILNVEWMSASVTSWYEDYANNNATALDGGAIYVTVEGENPVVTVDGVEVEVVDGKISGVATGSHNVVVTVKGLELVNRSVVVTPIPTASATIRTSYSNNGAKDITNYIPGTELQVTATLNETIPSNLISKSEAVYGSTTSNISLGSVSKFNLALGQHNCYAKVTLANGYVCQSETYAAYITGIPYTMNISANDGTWSTNGNVKWGDSNSVRMGYNVDNLLDWATETVTIERSFYLPSNVSVVAKCSGSANGSKFIFSQYSTTFTFSVSGTTVGSTESGKNSSKSFDYNSTVTMTSANPTVKCVNSTSTNQTCSRINGLSIIYAI